MANDLSNPVQAHQASGDGFFEHGAEADSPFGAQQLAQANAAAPQLQPGQTIHVTPPQAGAQDGPVVIRVEVAPGSTVELPQPFEADAALLAREGDGNLAIRVGDVTVILQGYVDANQQTPVTIEGADNQPIDIATILASTDPQIDIQTAAGAGDAAQGGQGADNTGAILSQLADGDGLSGFSAVGGQDQTELGYSTIDSSIRNDFADTLVTSDVFGFTVGTISTSFGEGRLRDPAQVGDLGDFENFLNEYRDAVVHDEPMYAGWADFNGNGITGGASDFEDYIAQTSQITTVDANFTGGTGDLVLTGIGNQVQSNHMDLTPTYADDGHTMFLRREDGALVAVVHVEQDGSGHFVIQTFLINRLDHPGEGKDSMDIEVLFKVYDGPAPHQPNPEEQPPQLEGGETNDIIPEGPTSPSIDGSFKASFADDVPILENISYHNQHDTNPAEARIAGGSDHGLIDEDWIRGGAHDQGVNGGNAGDDGDTGGGKCVTGCIDVSFGADGAAKSDSEGEGAGKHGFELNTGLKLGDFYGDLTSGGAQLKVLSISGDHITVGIPFGEQQSLTADTEGDEKPVTDPIPGCTIFTLTLDQDTGHFKFELKGPLDHKPSGDEIFSDESGLTALVAAPVEETIPLAFGVKATDDDGDSIEAKINIDVNDDVPVARDDSDSVSEGSHDVNYGNVITGDGTSSGMAGKDSLGGDGAVVVGVFAGAVSGGENDQVGQVIQGAYGKLTLQAHGGYSYTRDAYSAGGVDDVFTYTLKDGDGDESTAQLTIHITNAEVTVALPAFDAETTVYEAGLPGGSDASADSEQTEGTITITAKDGIKSLEIGDDTLSLEDLKDLSPSDPHKITDSTGELSLTGFNESTGELSYTYVLKDNTHGKDGTSVSFDIKVTDVDDDEGTATLQINIVDDNPTANCDTISLNAPKGASADVQFILDISGSMEDRNVSVDGYPDNGVGLERYAIQKMLDAHPEIQNVQFVVFDEHASHSDWMSRADALLWLKDGDNFKNGGGNTNFDAALDEAMDGLVEARPLPSGDQTLVYFFSDGEPNQPASDPGITDKDNGSQVSQAEWQDFVDTHGVTNVYAVGIGTLDPNEISELNPIAYPEASNGAEQNRLNITDTNTLGGLLQTLNDNIGTLSPITGNVTTNDVPGADGYGDGKLVSVSYGLDTFSFDATTHQHNIDLGAGRGSLLIKDDGSYTYTPPTKNADGTPFYVEYTIQDGDGDTSTAKLKIDINTGPSTDLNGVDCEGANNVQSFVENTLDMKIAPQGTVSSDGDLVSMTVTLTNRPDGNGTESLSLNQAAKDAAASDSDVSYSYDPATGKLTITGAASAAVYQSILQGIVYNNSSENPNETDRHVTVVVSDGVFQSVSHAIAIDVTAVNDAPDANIVPPSFNAKEGEELTLSTGSQLVISDVDAGSEDITVTLKVTEGELNVSKGNSGVHSISGDDTDTVTIVGTVAEINKLLSGGSSGYIKYLNDNDSPSSAVQLTLTVNDKGEQGIGGAKSDSDTAVIIVENVNDKPVTDLNGSSHGSDNWVSFTEDHDPVKIAASGTVKDDGMVSTLTATLTNHPDSGAEKLDLNQAAKDAVTGNGLSWNYDPATYKLTITGAAAASVYQTILQGIVYNNTSNTPNTQDRNVDVVVNDGQLNSTANSVEIEVNPWNDAPVATITPASYNAIEDQELTLSGTGLSISDPDAGNGTMTVTLAVGEGDLAVTKGSNSVTVNDFGGTVTLSGTVAQINSLLAGNNGGIIKYLNTNNTPSPTTTLSLKVDDNGNAGDGPDQESTDTATINVANANEKPETDLNGTGSGKSGNDNTASFTEDAGAIKIAPSGIVTDDSGKIGSMTVTLTNHPEGSAETLDLNTAAKNAVTSNGLSWNYDAATYKLTVSGPLVSQSVYQTILQGVLYNNASQAPTETTRSVTVVVNDGTDNSDSHTVTISVDAVNDAPVATITPASFNAVEDQELVLSGAGLAISDVDASNGVVTVTLSVGEGKLTVSGGNSGIDSVSGNNSGAVTVTGTLAEINNLLAGTSTGSVKYLNTNDTPSASTTLTLKVNDEGFTGGGDLISTDTATIFVANAPEAKDDSVYTNAGANAFNIPEWALLYNDAGQDVSKLDLAAAAAALSNVTGGTASHVDGAGTLGYVTFSDNNGSSSSGFDYKMGDGTLSDTGHVSVTQDSGNIDSSNNDDIVVVFGSNNTQVDAGGGNDIVLGGSGHNTLNGEDGNDVMLGGAGNDTMNGGNDNDQLYGEDGNDTLNGDDNNDTLYGGAGNDTLNGGNHDDVLNGGDNDDSLNGGSGSDTLHGDAGNDKLDGGSGSDLIFGDAGHDTMIYGSGDTFNGGDGFDRVQINGAGGVNIAYNESKFIGVEMIDLGAADAWDRSGTGNQNTLALNAADITYHGSANKIGSHEISLFVIGDIDGNSGVNKENNRDNVDLDQSNWTKIASANSFTDPIGETHTFDIYQSKVDSTVKVAIEQGVDVI